MKKVLFGLGLSALLLGGCQFGPVGQPSPSPTPTSRPSTSASPSGSPTVQLPADWSWLEDSILEFKMGYPQEWYATAAGAPIGEATVYSFNTEKSVDQGGVPESELKVGVTRFNNSDPARKLTIDESQVISKEDIMVNGTSATRRRMRGMGQNILVTVETPQYTYAIQAYPANSKYIETFEQMLQTFTITRGQDANAVVSLTNPQRQATITSPVTVAGQAPGNWFFEGVIPVEIQDEDGTVLGETSLSATGNWMTTAPVSFSGQITFEESDTETGYIVVKKDNPSGLPKNADQRRFAVSFSKQ